MLRSVQIVSFNSNEERAVDLLLDDIGASGIWVRHGERALRRLYGTDTWRIEHAPLRAQGNVIAAAQLAEFFLEHRNQDFIVFYGCAGALRPENTRSVFLVQRANYLSLGTVSQDAVERPSPSRISGSAISIRATTCFRLNECRFPYVLPGSGARICARLPEFLPVTSPQRTRWSESRLVSHRHRSRWVPHIPSTRRRNGRTVRR